MFSLFVLSSLLALGVSQQQDQEVAFSFALGHDLSLQSAAIVKYDTLITNFGGGYDATTGKFSAPNAGIYVFQFHLLTQSGGAAWLELYKNNVYVCTAYGHNANDYMSAGNSVILQLNKGDQVYIMSVDNSYGSDTDIYGRSDEIYSTFSGYMISPVYQEIPGHNGK